LPFLAFVFIRTSAAKPQRLLLKAKTPARKVVVSRRSRAETREAWTLRSVRFLIWNPPSVQPPARRPDVSNTAAYTDFCAKCKGRRGKGGVGSV